MAGVLSEQLTPEQIASLKHVTDLMHPHLAGQPHIYGTIEKVATQQRLTTSEIFDAGRDYARMLTYTEQVPAALPALMAFKWMIYQNY